MTTQSEYNTIANGSIDYAHYDRRARKIRSQDAWSIIEAIGQSLSAIATLVKCRTSSEVTPFENVPGRMPMRSPEARPVSPTCSPVKAEPMRR